jgi:hypothetical protein
MRWAIGPRFVAHHNWMVCAAWLESGSHTTGARNRGYVCPCPPARESLQFTEIGGELLAPKNLLLDGLEPSGSPRWLPVWLFES